MTTASAQDLMNAAVAAGFNSGNTRFVDYGVTSGSDAAIAVALALAESGGKLDATHHNTNGSTDYGAWQINSAHTEFKEHFADGSWASLGTNAQMAYSVFKSQGFGAWSTYGGPAFVLRMFQANALKTPSRTAAENALGGALSGPIGATTGAVGAAASAVSSTEQAAAQGAHVLSFLSAPGGWVRVIKVGAGLGLILIGVAAITRPVTQPAVRVAAKAAKVAAL